MGSSPTIDSKNPSVGTTQTLAALSAAIRAGSRVVSAWASTPTPKKPSSFGVAGGAGEVFDAPVARVDGARQPHRERHVPGEADAQARGGGGERIERYARHAR